MANTSGFQVVIEASAAVVRKALRGAWKSAECPVDPGDDGRIPQYMDVPGPIIIGSYTITDGQVQIPQDQLDATLAPDIDGVELKFGLGIQLQVEDPPVPSAQLLDMTADVRARVPVGTLPDSRDVGVLLDGLPRDRVTATLTSGHPLDSKLDTLLSEFIHLLYENGSADPPVNPFIPHVNDQLFVPIGFGSFTIAHLDTHTELFDNASDPARHIEVSRPDPNTLLISIPAYVRMSHITASLIALDDPMGLETRIEIRAPFETPPGAYRCKLTQATVTIGPITPASSTVAGSPNEGANYTSNKAKIGNLPLSPNLDTLVSTQIKTRAEQMAHGLGDFEIKVPTLQEIETAIGDFFHKELEARGFLAIWTPSATNADFEVDGVATRVITEALIIALNPGDGADVNGITGFIPADREFAISLDGGTVNDRIDQARQQNGFDNASLPKRMEQEGKKVDLKSLNVFLVDGAIRMEGSVTVIDAILGSIDVDATFRVDVGMHWNPNAALNADNVQKLDHHIIGDPDVDPEESVLFWVIAIILAIISFGAGSILLLIITIVVILVVEAIAKSIGSTMVVNGVTGAIDGIGAWPPDLAKIGRVIAVFHDDVAPDPDGIVIDTTGLLLEGTMDVLSSCEGTQVLAANSGGSYSVNAAAPLLLKAFNTSGLAAYRWLAGDGSAPVLAQNDLHTYTASGIYVAKHTLKIQQAGGNKSRHFALVDVRNVAPVVDAGADITVNEGELVTLVGHFTDVEPLDTHESIWNFGDYQLPEPGTIAETNQPPQAVGTSTVQHRWCQNGEYVVLLRVRDQNGGVGSDTLKVTVLNVPPLVEAGPDLYAYTCTAITLVGKFKDPGWCDRHTGTWSFGDCTPTQTAVITEINEPPAARGIVVASHVYEHCGTFHVVCTVVDQDGAVGTDFTVVRVIDVENKGFEHGYRALAQGRVANGWYPYPAPSADVMSVAAAATPAYASAYRCEECVVHDGQRSQGIELSISTRRGIYQLVGANPGWGYQVNAWYSLSESSTGVARLGVDPDGGTDPDAASVVWSAGAFAIDWAQLVVRVAASGTAITIFLEAGVPEGDGAPKEPRGGTVYFDDVALIPIQPFCPEQSPEKTPEDRCVDFADLKPDAQLPATYDKQGFRFTALDHEPLTVTTAGPPPSQGKLELRQGVFVDLPFPAAAVVVDVAVAMDLAVYCLAMNGSGEIVGQAQTTPTGGFTLQTLEIEAEGIVRLQVGGKGTRDALVRVCAHAAVVTPTRKPSIRLGADREATAAMVRLARPPTSRGDG